MATGRYVLNGIRLSGIGQPSFPASLKAKLTVAPILFCVKRQSIDGMQDNRENDYQADGTE
jgi:hypothetical protein